VLTNYVTDKVGLPTLKDIMAELTKPGRDPRQQFENVVFAEGIEKMADLIPGMKLTGVVTNITAFGAFVDIGVHQDGLVHLSEMADRFVKTPADVVKVNQKVEVTVLAVDAERKRISLSMKKTPGEKKANEKTVDQKNAVEPPARLCPAARKIEPGKPSPMPEKKKVREAPKPFNNPFAEALKKK
jgi:protein Tex